MSELYDCDSAKAGRAMKAVFDSMRGPQHGRTAGARGARAASFVLIEPVSLHTATKQQWCADFAVSQLHTCIPPALDVMASSCPQYDGLFLPSV